MTIDEHLSSARETAAYAAGVEWLRALAILGALAMVALVNGDALMSTVKNMLATGGGTDWNVFVHSAGTNPFSQPGWRWSPVAAWLWVPLGLMGLAAWQVLHVVALGLLPSWRLRIALLLAWPFWWDVSAGNIMIFIFIAAYWMLRRNPVGTLMTLMFAMLVPRPLEIALVAWVLWRQPEWRIRFVALAVINAALILASGEAWAFAARLASVGPEDIALWTNVGPSALVGIGWLFVAVPLGVFTFVRGRVAAASLLANPYWLPYYLLIPLLDLAIVLGARDSRQGTTVSVHGPSDVSTTQIPLGSALAGEPARKNGRIASLMQVLSHSVCDRWRLWVGPVMVFGLVAAIFPGHASAAVTVAWIGLAALVVVSLGYWAWRIAQELKFNAVAGLAAGASPDPGSTHSFGTPVRMLSTLAGNAGSLIWGIGGASRTASWVVVATLAMLALGVVLPGWHSVMVVCFGLAILYVGAETVSRGRPVVEP